ncbi:MAG: class I SAM-dependent methyltransferase [Solirubrobacterales bacterium]|nr:class I SAM-dependent methyltransferase [Solirubrobacterales bacterium]
MFETAVHGGHPTVETVNARHWPGKRAARRRARRELRPAEGAMLVRYADELSGDVLELDSRGDRLTAALAARASSLTGIGVSAPTVKLCRERHPGARFLQQNLTDLDDFADDQFSAVVAGRFALDLLSDDQRRFVFEQLNRILEPGGLLIFSSHNLACESLVRTPGRHVLFNPLRILWMPRYLRNRAQLARLQQREHGYAMLNTPAISYGLLSYHISRDGQERQLFEHDMRLLECVTVEDRAVERRQDAYRQTELYYVAQPLAFSPAESGGDLEHI